MYQTDPAAAALADSSAQISLVVVNAASGKPAIEVGATTTLDVTLANTGSTPLPLFPGSSVLTLYLPDYLPAAALPATGVDLAGWTFAASVDAGALSLTYAGAQGGEWIGDLHFQISGVVAQGGPADGYFQVNPTGITGAPGQISAYLPLIAAPQPGNLSLADVLQVSLDNGGAVYVTDSASDPLANTLLLNIKNIGADALYVGDGSPSGAEIAVSFTYGNTSGAIAPAEPVRPDAPPTGSAWTIVADVYVDQTQGWRVLPARSSDAQPIWRLAPQGGNANLIGTDDESNVTFDFSHLVSMTPIGHIQMTLNFRGFRKSATQGYDPLIVVLDIVKQGPPQGRGLLSFFGTDSPIKEVASQSSPIAIPLRWSMAAVNQVQIFSSFPGVTSDFAGLAPGAMVYAAAPATPPSLSVDKATVTIPATTQTGAVTLTIQARDGNGAYLNALQYTCYLQMEVFVDPRDGQAYPIVLIGSKYWMAANLNYAEAGSYAYNNMSGNVADYGRLYTANATSVLSPPGEWHVPSFDDWTALFEGFGSPGDAYAALTAATSGGFAGKLGGRYVPTQFYDLMVNGYYQVAGNPTYASFVLGSRTVALAGTLPTGAALSLRYVRDL